MAKSRAGLVELPTDVLTSCVLYVDILGTRERWFRPGAGGGPDAADRAFKAFKGALTDALSASRVRTQTVTGLLNADGVALRFTSVKGALNVGIRLFQESFEIDLGSHDRLWIRGVIAPSTDSQLVEERSLNDWNGIVSLVPTPSTLRATIAEHSGFHGMRLLVHGDLLTETTRETFEVPVLGLRVNRFLSLRRIADSRHVTDYEEVLWMLDEWPSRRERMERRLRLAGRDQSEFVQASATALTFARCDLRVQKTSSA